MFGPNNCSSSPALLNTTIYVYCMVLNVTKRIEDIGLVTTEIKLAIAYTTYLD